MDHAITMGSDILIMGYDDDCCPAVMNFPEYFHDIFAGRRIQLTCRFISQ